MFGGDSSGRRVELLNGEATAKESSRGSADHHHHISPTTKQSDNLKNSNDDQRRQSNRLSSTSQDPRYVPNYIDPSDPNLLQGGYASMPQMVDPYFDRTQMAVTNPAYATLPRSTLSISTHHPSPFQPSASSSPTVQHTPIATRLQSPKSIPTPTSASVPDGDDFAQAGGEKKKKYPCPHAQKFSCIDRFTTSGHAARHGKKHTGEKNVVCPTCHKTFTRKDNMKQHERTHSNKPTVDGEDPRRSSSVLSQASVPTRQRSSARDSGNTSTSSTSTTKTRSSTDMLSKTPSSQSRHSLGSSNQSLSQALTSQPFSTRRGSTYQSTHSPTMMQDARGSVEIDGEGDSPGLDALAYAASGLSR